MSNFQKVFLYFIFITVLYIIINITVILNNNINNTKYIEYIYLFIVIFGIFTFNITSYEQNSKFTIFLYTLTPWIIIFFSIYFLLKFYNNWITPFSNTIGYVFVNILGLSELFKTLINKSQVTHENATDKNAIQEAIMNFNNNYEILLNSLDPYDRKNFEDFFTSFQEAGILNITASNKDIDLSNDIKLQKIKRLLYIKDFIGKVCWYLLSGMLTITVMVNSLQDI